MIEESLHRRLREVAEHEGESVNQLISSSAHQLISSAVAEKMSALLTEEYLNTSAKKGNRKNFAAALRKVSGVQPELHDVRDSPAPTKKRFTRQ